MLFPPRLHFLFRKGELMRYFDLHCDTLSACGKKGQGLTDNGCQVDFNKIKADSYIQCFAVWIPDSLRGEAAFSYFMDLASLYQEEASKGVFVPITDAGRLRKNNIARGGILAVESGAAFAGKLDHIRTAAALGVRLVTLTWNGRNELGAGVGYEDGQLGLSDFGKKAVRVMQEEGIIPDVSHGSRRLFDDLCQCTEKPFIASHSNAYRVCHHKRNLSDDQILEIVRRGGLIGLNFYRDFLDNQPEQARMESIFEHAEYFLSLGSENCVAMGSDFDGSDLPLDMRGIEDVGALYEIFLRHNYSEELTDKLFYKNAADFMLRWL